MWQICFEIESFTFFVFLHDFQILSRCCVVAKLNCRIVVAGPALDNILSLLFSCIFVSFGLNWTKVKLAHQMLPCTTHAFFKWTHYTRTCAIYEGHVNQMCINWYHDSHAHLALFLLATNESNVHQLLSWFPTTFGTFLLATKESYMQACNLQWHVYCLSGTFTHMSIVGL